MPYVFLCEERGLFVHASCFGLISFLSLKIVVGFKVDLIEKIQEYQGSVTIVL